MAENFGASIVDALEQVDKETRNQLIDKCQENEWVKYDGYAWQDDPYLEQYPYAFCVARNMESLREFFVHGNWAIRQGILYNDLAFIQQVDGGDEWWTLKRTPEGWVEFESMSFDSVAREPLEFARQITSMQMATPAQCECLEYMLPDNDYVWDSYVVQDIGFDGREINQRFFETSKNGYQLVVAEDAASGRYNALIYYAENEHELFYRRNIDALTGAALLESKADGFIEQGITRRDQLTKDLSLTARAEEAWAISQLQTHGESIRSVDDHAFALR